MMLAKRTRGKARAALDAMVQALGGPVWLNMKNRVQHGHVAAFYQGKPDPGTTEYWDYHAWPDRHPHRVDQAPRRG